MADRVRTSPKEKEAPAPKAKGNEAMIVEIEHAMLIDKDALDDMLIQHPDLVYRVSKALIELVSQRDAAKQDKSEAEAMADAEIRRDAAVAEEKITADQVKAEIKVNKGVIKATDRLAECEYRVKQWQALQEAFSARGHALRDLVSLYANNYWSDASAGRASHRKREEDGGAAREALARERRRTDDRHR